MKITTTLVFAIMALTALAPAEQVILEPTKDGTLYDVPEFDVSNGMGQHFFAGTTAQLVIRRALVAFDVAGNVPAGATITNAALELNMSMTVTNPRTVTLHRALSDWGEGASDAPDNEGVGAFPEPNDVTWIHTFFDDQFWDTPGGDFDPTISGEQIVGFRGSYTWESTPHMVADVQSWLDKPRTNFGWIVIGDESTGQTSKRFDSVQHPDPRVRPKLIIDYTLDVHVDLNGDSVIDGSDLLILLNAWGPNVSPADFDADGRVGGSDLLILLNNWG